MTLPANAVAGIYGTTVGSSTTLACDANYAAYPTNYSVNCVASNAGVGGGAWNITGGTCLRAFVV